MTASTEEQHGGNLVAKALKAQGVEFVFTLCGGHISPLLIGCEDVGITVIDVRDEKNAAFAADAISRLSGTPGVVAVTAGPGVTNTITAIKNAQLAESSLVVLGGATATMLEGRGALQDIDQLGLLETATKWSTSVRSVREIIPKIQKGFRTAQSEVPGPVFIEVPVDILYPRHVVEQWYQASSTDDSSILGKLSNWYINRHVNNLFRDQHGGFTPEKQVVTYPKPTTKQIDEMLIAIDKSTKPVMVLSSQVVLRVEKVHDLVASVEKMGIPVFLSGMARGLLGKDHPLHIRHKRSKALRNADLIILAGVPLDFRLDYGRGLNRRATVISINLSKHTLRMNRIFRNIDLKIHADPLLTLITLASKWVFNAKTWKIWHDELRERQQEREAEIHKMAMQETEFVNPLALCELIDEIMDDDSVIVADGGDFVATVSYIIQPRGPLRWLDPGPYGTLGVGAGFAIGAKLIRPSSTIWLMYGDGAAGFSIKEFDTMVRHHIPVIGIIGNDASWQQIAREQVDMFESSLATDLDYTAYEKVVEGYGGRGIAIEQMDEAREQLLRAMELVKEGKPVLVNVKIGKTEFRKGSISM